MTHSTNTGSNNRIVLISDIHYHLFQAFSPDGGRSRLADISSVVQQCKDYCVRQGIKNVAILGDVFEKRGVIDSVVYNAFTDDLKGFLEADIDVYIIPGNHDQDLISNATESNSLEPLAKLSPKLHIMSKPKIVPFFHAKVFFVPYIHDAKELERYMKLYATEYAFIHAGILGAKLIDSDYKVKHGLDVSQYPNTKIFSGHYHTPQVVGNAVYLGSPLHHRFNDEGQEKNFIDLDLDTGEYIRVPTVYPKFIRKQITDLNEIFAIDSNDYYKLSVHEKVLTDDHHAHLQAHTKNYEVIYMLKKETENYNAKFDSDLQCLRKFIVKEFGGNHKELYLKAKEYIC
jgi:DNA repair exonuclease SbcCD nuclease subunit